MIGIMWGKGGGCASTIDRDSGESGCVGRIGYEAAIAGYQEGMGAYERTE